MPQSVVIYANCQGDGLAHFLKRMGSESEFRIFRNYQIILGEQSYEELCEAARAADVFIYQPTGPQHEHCSTDHILFNVLPSRSRRISFGYCFNHGRFPLIRSGKGTIHGALEIGGWLTRLPLKECVAMYRSREMQFCLWERFLECLKEQAIREQTLDVRMTGWMLENFDRQLLLNVNHPSSPYFIKLAQRVWPLLEAKRYSPVQHWRTNEINLPCPVPRSDIEITTFRMNAGPDPAADAFYEELLIQAWREQNPNHA